MPDPHDTPYAVGVAIGAMLLLPQTQLRPGSALSFFARMRVKTLQNYRDTIALDATTREDAYAGASLGYVMGVVMDLFKGDSRGMRLFHESPAATLMQAYTANAFVCVYSKFVGKMFDLLDELVQKYNESVPSFIGSERFYSECNLGVLDGVFQTIYAPRAWIILQILQMRCVYDPHNRKMLQMGIRVVYTDLTVFKTPRYSASDWLKTVNWSGLLFSGSFDDFREVAPDDSVRSVELILGLLIATAGNNAHEDLLELNRLVFEGMHILKQS